MRRAITSARYFSCSDSAVGGAAAVATAAVAACRRLALLSAMGPSRGLRLRWRREWWRLPGAPALWCPLPCCAAATPASPLMGARSAWCRRLLALPVASSGESRGGLCVGRRSWALSFRALLIASFWCFAISVFATYAARTDVVGLLDTGWFPGGGGAALGTGASRPPPPRLCGREATTPGAPSRGRHERSGVQRLRLPLPSCGGVSGTPSARGELSHRLATSLGTVGPAALLSDG